MRDDLLAKGAVHGLKVGDVVSRSMGAAGEDLMMSPKAMEVFPFVIECKNCESLNVRKVFDEHYSKYDKRVGLKMLVHSKNHSEPLVTLRLKDFIEVFDIPVRKS